MRALMQTTAERTASRTLGRRAVALVLLALLLLPAPSVLAAADDDVFALDLDALASLDIEITSVSKKQERAAEAAAAIAVLTAEDIRRAGATSIAEALRLVPGVQVGRLDSNSWGISVRGFADEFANYLLVLVDGRTVYNPLFGGVYWDVQDLVLEDIARIEVIRGPGATVWGANAVNGVINIITKSAEETQGVLASVTAGSGVMVDGDTEETGTGVVRFGGKVGDDFYYRIYGKHIDRDDFNDLNDDRGTDEWDQTRAGFRTDWDPAEETHVTIQGDVYTGHSGVSLRYVENVVALAPAAISGNALPLTNTRAPTDVFGLNVLGRATQALSDSSSVTGQFYYDLQDRDTQNLHEVRDTVDLDLQYSLDTDFDAFKNGLIVGIAYRWTHGEFEDTSYTSDPGRDEQVDHLLSAFIQNEIRLLEEQVRFTVGSKFERNDFTGFEYQPSVRLAYVPSETMTVWGALSRAVRTPTIVEDDWDNQTVTVLPNSIPIGGPFANIDSVIQLAGDRNVESDVMYAIEGGFRLNLDEAKTSLDVAAFYNRYNNAVDVDFDSLTPMPMPFPPVRGGGTVPDYIVLQLPFLNTKKGYTLGGEVMLTTHPFDWWRGVVTYSYLEATFRRKGSGDEENGESPHRVTLQSRFNLPFNVEFDQTFYWVDGVDKDPENQWVRLDLRLGWRPIEHLELSLAVLNVNERTHQEARTIIADLGPTGKIPRSGYAKVTFTW